MPRGLIRYHHTGHFHFVTFSCHRRQQFFHSAKGRGLFERSLEVMRLRYDFVVAGYVVMPEHVHLLVSEPKKAVLSKALQALKLSVSVQSKQRPFWQVRYYDFNVYSPGKRSEKIDYMHRNPVRRGLVADPMDWLWSSYHHYATGERGTVEIESEWTAARRNRATA
jgi:putative transposase